MNIINENNKQAELAELIHQVKDSFKEHHPYDALEWMADSGYTIHDSPELKAVFDANIAKIANMIIEHVRFGDYNEYHQIASIRTMLESIGIKIPNDQIASILYNSSRVINQELYDMIDHNQFIDAVNFAREFDNWGLEILIDDYAGNLDERQLKKTIIKSLVDVVTKGGYNKSNLIDIITHIREQGYDYPEFNVILSNL